MMIMKLPLERTVALTSKTIKPEQQWTPSGWICKLFQTRESIESSLETKYIFNLLLKVIPKECQFQLSSLFKFCALLQRISKERLDALHRDHWEDQRPVHHPGEHWPRVWWRMWQCKIWFKYYFIKTNSLIFCKGFEANKTVKIAVLFRCSHRVIFYQA